MKLYHGSNTEIDVIDLSKSKKYKDFGTGFYLTTILDQAIERAIAVTNRDGKEPVVTTFEFDSSDLTGIKFKKFDKVDMDWALFITNNRNKDFKDINNELSNHDNKYDIVYGPVADDNVLGTIGLFLNDVVDLKYLTKKLKYKKLNNQYSFHTKKALKLLTKKEAQVYYKTIEQDMIIQYLMTKLLEYIAKDKDVSIEEAMKLFYETELSRKLEDVKTGYYKESASYLYEILNAELNK